MNIHRLKLARARNIKSNGTCFDASSTCRSDEGWEKGPQRSCLLVTTSTEVIHDGVSYAFPYVHVTAINSERHIRSLLVYVDDIVSNAVAGLRSIPTA